METIDITDLSGVVETRRNSVRENNQSIEERSFQAAMIMIEAHLAKHPPVGRKTLQKSIETVRRTMEKTLNKADVRERLAKNVDIWMRLRLIFNAALPSLVERSCRELYVEDTMANQRPEHSAMMALNHGTLVEDLHLLNSLLVIARNMLAIKEVAQDICSATGLHNEILRFISHCIYVTSKGYDGEHIDPPTRNKVNEILELYKKLLVTSLQFTHNLTMGNDRLKMIMWFEILHYRDSCDWSVIDDTLGNESDGEKYAGVRPDGFRINVFVEEMQNWFRRNTAKAPDAQRRIDEYESQAQLGATPGPLPGDRWEEKIVNEEGHLVRAPPPEVQIVPKWSEEALNVSKKEQDRLYGRVSHELDMWWRRVRDPNHESWVVPMETVDGAIAKAQSCKDSAMTRYIPRVDHEQDYDHAGDFEEGESDEEHDEASNRSYQHDGTDAGDDEDDEDDEDDSFVEEPLRGLMTEVPNILDTKQIEALHMTVKACVVDSMGSGLTQCGENLQRTRCKMFLALDFGKNLLREILVFIAVWEQSEDQFIFQVTAQIIEAIHHNALLPYAWNSLRILKDIVSPAQTILLRIVSYIFRSRRGTTAYPDMQEFDRDAKLVHFLYNYFRTRVVPDCLGLIYAQSQVRNNHSHPSDFPVDLWDMERAKDGLSQYLDFLAVVADIPNMRQPLIDWEVIYELIALLNALEAGVARKPLVDPMAPPGQPVERPYEYDGDGAATPNLPPLHDTPHKYPWAGIKVQILIILTSLVAPPDGRRGPGNARVQKQIMKYGGIMALLNCCVYDGHNEYLKERATLALKFVMDGCDEAQQFVRDLTPLKNQNPNQQQQQSQSQQQSQQPAPQPQQHPPPHTLPIRTAAHATAATTTATATAAQLGSSAADNHAATARSAHAHSNEDTAAAAADDDSSIPEPGVPLSPESNKLYQQFYRLAEQSRALTAGRK